MGRAAPPSGYAAAHAPRPPRGASTITGNPRMKLSAALTLLAVVALLTPVAAMLGLYDTTMGEVARFAGPALGAFSAVFFMRWFARRG